MGNKMDKVIFPTSDYIEISPPTKSLCGSIASFSDGGNAPIPSLTASIVPVQDLHGYDSPWAGGAGKNKLPLTVNLLKSVNGGANTWNNNSKEINGITYTIQVDDNGNVIGINANGTATSNSIIYLMGTSSPQIELSGQSVIISLSGFNRGAYKDNSWHDILSTSTESTVTLNGAISQIWGQINNGVTVNNIVLKPMIRLSSVADSAFAPYSNICPISGWDECNVGVSGKNLCKSTIHGYVSSADDLIIIDNDTESAIFYAREGQTYTISSSATMNKSRVALVGTDNVVNYTPILQREILTDNINTWTATWTGWTVWYKCSSRQTAFDNSAQVELGSTATTYEPYNGATYTIDLDGTRYGGTLDVASGVLTVDRAYYNISDITFSESGNYYRLLDASIPFAKSQFSEDGILSHFNYGERGECIVGTTPSSGHYIMFYKNKVDALLSISSVADFNAYLVSQKTNGNPVQLVYELATPITIQLTPTAVKSLDGENNVFASTGDVCVTYVTQEYQDLTVNYAETAAKLGSSNVGSATQPIYLNGGTATACTYTLGKSVPSDAVFTDTDTKVTQTETSTNADYELLFSSSTADSTTHTEGARKDDNLRYNPSSNTLQLRNPGSSTSMTPSSISLSNSGGGGISIDNTNNKIEVGKSGTSITYSNTDVVTSNGNTWDGTNTSLKSAITAAASDTKVTQTATTTDANYEILFSNSANNTTETAGARKDSGLIFNPSKDALTAGSRKSGSTVGTSSIALGYDLTASGSNSHAEGYNTTASGPTSHAEGGSTTASGTVSHAEGDYTTASGQGSHAEGGSTTASGNYSYAGGLGTVANHMCQHVFGMGNIPDPSTAETYSVGNYIEIVGNGTDPNNLSNARTLDWSGNEWLANGVDIGDASVQYQGDSSDQYYYNLTASLKLEDYYELGILFPTLQLHSDFYDGSYTTKRSTLMMPGVIKLQYPVSISDTSVVTMSSSDITLSGSTGISSNTWDGTNTSLKDTFSHTPYVVPCPETEGYPMILGPHNDNEWICFGGADGGRGIIPSKKGTQGNGHCNIGTSSWYWANSFIDNMYGGTLTTSTGKWYTDGTYAINLNNSDIVGINGLYFADRVDSKGEGIMFARSNGNWDDLYSYDGSLRYCVNRTTTGERGSYYTILHTGNGVSNNGGTYTGGNKTAGKCMHGVGSGHSYACEWGSNLAFWVDVTKVATVSDRRLKNDIEEINWDLVRAIAECKTYQYKAFNRNGLISVGIIAQDLVENCKKYGVDPLKYELMTQEEFIDGDPTLYYHIEYDQYLTFKSMWLQHQIDELKDLIKKQ